MQVSFCEHHMLLQYLAMLCLPFLLFAQIERFRKYNCLDPNIHISITFISPTEKQFIVSNGKRKKKKKMNERKTLNLHQKRLIQLIITSADPHPKEEHHSLGNTPN